MSAPGVVVIEPGAGPGDGTAASPEVAAEDTAQVEAQAEAAVEIATVEAEAAVEIAEAETQAQVEIAEAFAADTEFMQEVRAWQERHEREGHSDLRAQIALLEERLSILMALEMIQAAMTSATPEGEAEPIAEPRPPEEPPESEARESREEPEEPPTPHHEPRARRYRLV